MNMKTILLPYASKSDKYETYVLHGIHINSYKGEFGDAPLSLLVTEERVVSHRNYDKVPFDEFKSLNIKHVYLGDLITLRRRNKTQRPSLYLPDTVTDLTIKTVNDLFLKCDIYAKSLKRLHFVDGHGFYPTSYKNGWLGYSYFGGNETPSFRVQVDQEKLEELHIAHMQHYLKVGDVLKGFKNLRSLHIPYNLIESIDDIPTDNLEELHLLFGELGPTEYNNTLLEQYNKDNIFSGININKQLSKLKDLKRLKYTVFDEYDDLSELINLEELDLDSRYMSECSTDKSIADSIKGLKLKGLSCSVFDRHEIDKLIKSQPNMESLGLFIGYSEESLDLNSLSNLRRLTIYAVESSYIPKEIKSDSVETMHIYCYDESKEVVTPFKSDDLPRLNDVEINGVKESKILDLFSDIDTIKTLTFVEDPLGYNYYVDTFGDSRWFNTLEQLDIQFNNKIIEEIGSMKGLKRLILRDADMDLVSEELYDKLPNDICYIDSRDIYGKLYFLIDNRYYIHASRK